MVNIVNIEVDRKPVCIPVPLELDRGISGTMTYFHYFRENNYFNTDIVFYAGMENPARVPLGLPEKIYHAVEKMKPVKCLKKGGIGFKSIVEACLWDAKESTFESVRVLKENARQRIKDKCDEIHDLTCPMTPNILFQNVEMNIKSAASSQHALNKMEMFINCAKNSKTKVNEKEDWLWDELLEAVVNYLAIKDQGNDYSDKHLFTVKFGREAK